MDEDHGTLQCVGCEFPDRCYYIRRSMFECLSAIQRIIEEKGDASALELPEVDEVLRRHEIEWTAQRRRLPPKCPAAIREQ